MTQTVSTIDPVRRGLLGVAVISAAAGLAPRAESRELPGLRRVKAGDLEIAYAEDRKSTV